MKEFVRKLADQAGIGLAEFEREGKAFYVCSEETMEKFVRVIANDCAHTVEIYNMMNLPPEMLSQQIRDKFDI
jgi:hypothetical protein